MLWLTFALGSALFLGLYDVAKKSALDDNDVLSVLALTSVIGSLLLGAVVLVASTTPWLTPFRVESLAPHEHLLVLGKSALVSASWLATFFALKHLPLSLASPLRASAPLFTLLGALVIFGERPSALAWCGIVLIVASYFWLARAGRKEDVVLEKNSWVLLLLFGTLLGSLSALYDKHLLASGSRDLEPTTLQLWFTLYHSFFLGALWLAFHARRVAPEATVSGSNARRFTFRWSIVGIAVFLLLADQLYFRALALPGSLIAFVSLIRRSNVLVSFTVGGLLFRERHLRHKAGALVGLVVGLALLLLGH